MKPEVPPSTRRDITNVDLSLLADDLAEEIIASSEDFSAESIESFLMSRARGSNESIEAFLEKYANIDEALKKLHEELRKKFESKLIEKKKINDKTEEGRKIIENYLNNLDQAFDKLRKFLRRNQEKIESIGDVDEGERIKMIGSLFAQRVLDFVSGIMGEVSPSGVDESFLGGLIGELKKDYVYKFRRNWSHLREIINEKIQSEIKEYNLQGAIQRAEMIKRVWSIIDHEIFGTHIVEEGQDREEIISLHVQMMADDLIQAYQNGGREMAQRVLRIRIVDLARVLEINIYPQFLSEIKQKIIETLGKKIEEIKERQSPLYRSLPNLNELNELVKELTF